MKTINFLHYQSGNSIYHRHDARMKLLELCGWSIIALKGPPLALMFLGMLISGLYVLSGGRFWSIARALVFWGFMALAIIIFSTVSFQEGLYIDRNALPEAVLQASRLLLMLICSHLFISTTNLLSITEALGWSTAFLPASWSALFSVTVSLSLGFVPWIMESALQASEAAKSRALSAKCNPFRYALHLSLPLAHITLRRTEVTADAMLSRNFLNRPRIQSSRIFLKDFLLLFLLLLIPLLAGPADAFLT